MANVSFVLKEPTSQQDTLVYMLFRHKGQKIKFSTSEKILPRYWNPEKQRAKESKQFVEFPEFNSHLDRLETTVKTIYRKLNNDGTPITAEIIKNQLTQELKGDTIKQGSDLLKFGEELVQSSAKRPNTVKNYKLLLTKLREYQAQTKKPLHFDNINLEFYNDFTRFINQKGYSTNYLGTLVKNIKVFMNEATDRGLNKNMEYLNKRFKVVEEHSDTIYLGMDEIKRLYELDLSKDERLQKVRDLFIVGCCTGLRFSDLEKVSGENFIKDNTQIKIKTQKTGDTVIIPVHPYIKQIYSKYGNRLPASISNQKMNDYLKEIGKLAEFNDKALISMTKGGIREQESFLKYELISTHTARRSFATNAYLMDIDTISIMKITGHKTEKAFMKYIRLSKEQNADKLTNHPFFN